MDSLKRMRLQIADRSVDRYYHQDARMGFHICSVRDTIITALGPHLRMRFFLYSTQVMYQVTAALRKTCQRCCKQSLIITTLHEGLIHGKAAVATVGAAVARYC